MKRLMIFLTIVSLILSLTDAIIVSQAYAITVPAIGYGTTLLDEAGSEGESAYNAHHWHTFPTQDLNFRTDVEEAPGYALFDLSSIDTPISGAYLSLSLIEAQAGHYQNNIPIWLHDINDLEALKPPAQWPASYEAYLESATMVKHDLIQGVNFGEFNVTVDSPPMLFQVPLSMGAIDVINDSLGGMFGIGFGIDWRKSADKSNTLSFESVELRLTPVPEPGTLLLLASGAAILLKTKRLRKHQPAG